jgi:BirA family transcriptional regulator, biotin operon repressor / biotin---[acetyl-CoA-carboxylase] ligase
MSAGPPLPDFFFLHHFSTLESTNDEAKRRAGADAAEGLVVMADTQSAGRGRQGRRWHSPPGNLYVSLVLRPSCTPAAAAQLGFAASLAVAEALAPLLPPSLEPRCKWPNDVLVDGRKIAGILLESEAVGPRLAWLVVGIGVNIAAHPVDAETPATSLAALGAPAIAPADLLSAVCARLSFWYESWRGQGFPPLRAAWRDRAYGIGGEVRVRATTGEERGRFADLDEGGALVLETEAGRQYITAGAVFPAG